MKQKKIILLAGPTASGKSRLAIKLALHLNGEIINADSMQIYKEISILTSKPSKKDTTIIKHHLYDFNSVKKKSGLDHKGWDDDWSFCVFLAIFFTFITASIYY